MAQFQIILAHPLEDSFCAAIAKEAQEHLLAEGHEVDFLDLYKEGFDPRLTPRERRAYYGEEPPPAAMDSYTQRLQATDKLVLVFPQWWFNFPAILKGYFDRVFQPGVAFDHTPGYGQIRPRLSRLSGVLAVTTLGSPWWVSAFFMGDPAGRQLKRGIVKTCAPKARFRMLNCYGAEKIDTDRRQAFIKRAADAAASL